MTTPETPPFERWPNEKEKALIILLATCTMVAFLILVIDWKIKQDILRISKEFTDYAGQAAAVNDPSVVVAGIRPHDDSVVDGATRMEAPTSLKDYAKGTGRKEPAATTPRDGVGAFRGSGSGDMEVPAESGQVEPGGE